MYGPHDGAPMAEATPLRGDGSRGTTRRLLTEELFAAHRAGEVCATSVRASDLLGPHVTESLVGERFFGPYLSNRKVQVFADPDVPDSVELRRRRRPGDGHGRRTYRTRRPCRCARLRISSSGTWRGWHSISLPIACSTAERR